VERKSKQKERAERVSQGDSVIFKGGNGGGGRVYFTKARGSPKGLKESKVRKI